MPASTRFGRALLVLAALLALLVPRPARGQGAREVRLVVAGDGAGALEAVVRERLAEAGAQATIRREPSVDPRTLMVPPQAQPGVLAHVWIDFSRAERAVMLLLDARVERGLLRYVSRAAGDEIAREEIGHVLQTAVEALMAGERIGLTREELGLPARVSSGAPRPKGTPPAPAPATPVEDLVPRAPPPPDHERWWLRSGAAYEVGTFAGVAPVTHGPGVALEVLRVRDRAPLAWGLRLTGQWRFPVEARASSFVVRLHTWAVRAQGVATYALGGRWSMAVALGGGLDLVRVLPQSTTGPEASLGPPDTAVFPMARASIGATRAGPVRLSLWLLGDVDVGGVHYGYLSRDKVPARLFDTYPLRPGIGLEIGTP